jgi:hypothetical protein
MGLNSPLNSSACKPIICHLIHTTLGSQLSVDWGLKGLASFAGFIKIGVVQLRLGKVMFLLMAS